MNSELIFLGEGKSRIAYFDPDKHLVVKKPKNTVIYNELEWEVWLAVKDTQFACYFCPCRHLDEKGNLWCEYTEDVTPQDMIGAMRPFGGIYDEYIRNFGLYKGRVVLRDYPDLKSNLDFVLNPEGWEPFNDGYLALFEKDYEFYLRNERKKEGNQCCIVSIV